MYTIEASPYFFKALTFLNNIKRIPPENTRLATFKAILVELILALVSRVKITKNSQKSYILTMILGYIASLAQFPHQAPLIFL